MRVFFYERPGDMNGFSRRKTDVIRVEIVRLYNLALDKTSYHWCEYGAGILENIPVGNIAIESIEMAAEALAKESGWTLLAVVPSPPRAF